MMNIGPDEARRLSIWEYEALLYNWNEAHKLESDGPTPPAPEVTQRLIDELRAHPEYLKKTKGEAAPMMPARLDGV